MNRVFLAVLFLIFLGNAHAEDLSEPAGEKSLNTANVIRAAWELRRLAESLEPGVDTRCYIAKFAAFKAKNLPASAEVVAQYQSSDSDAFAIQSVKQAMEIFDRNQVQDIASGCETK